MTLKTDKEPWGDYTERELYGMITDVYAYVFELVFRVPCTNDEHSFLFLDLDPSKSMNIELSAREHIKTLQHHIRANIVADVGGKVSVALFSAFLIILTQPCSSLSQISSAQSSPYSLRRQRSRNSLLRRASLKMALQSSVRRITCCRYLLVPPSSFPSVSFLSFQSKR